VAGLVVGRVRAARLGLVLVLLVGGGLAGCAAPARIAVPPDLPLQTYDQGYTMRWALERSPERVRAVGLISTSGFGAEPTLVTLYGWDARGRVVSRGDTAVRRRIDPTPTAFEVSLRPSGTETRFDLRVGEPLGPADQEGMAG
jgi:hypothetical protein